MNLSQTLKPRQVPGLFYLLPQSMQIDMRTNHITQKHATTSTKIILKNLHLLWLNNIYFVRTHRRETRPRARTFYIMNTIQRCKKKILK